MRIATVRQARRLCARAAPVCAALTLTERADAAATDRPWLLTLPFENDLFAGFDEQYTNGSHLPVSLTTNDLPTWARWAREGLSGIIYAPRRQAAYGLGQSMFTPSDITDPDPPLDDRPYAAFLFGSL